MVSARADRRKTNRGGNSHRARAAGFDRTLLWSARVAISQLPLSVPPPTVDFAGVGKTTTKPVPHAHGDEAELTSYRDRGAAPSYRKVTRPEFADVIRSPAISGAAQGKSARMCHTEAHRRILEPTDHGSRHWNELARRVICPQQGVKAPAVGITAYRYPARAAPACGDCRKPRSPHDGHWCSIRGPTTRAQKSARPLFRHLTHHSRCRPNSMPHRSRSVRTRDLD